MHCSVVGGAISTTTNPAMAIVVIEMVHMKKIAIAGSEWLHWETDKLQKSVYTNYSIMLKSTTLQKRKILLNTASHLPH